MVVRDTSKPTLVFNKSIRSIIEGSRAVSLNGEERADSNVESTSSFFYDPPTLGLKSTQQLNVDWSKFENHTFFGSAEVNVNVAFDQIINNFPFDGTRKEFETYFEKLTGFEKYVYDRFPKNVGYLNFANSSSISVQDYAGSLLPDLSKNKTGQSVLDPGLGSFSIELQLFSPTVANGTQVICQKISGSTQGFDVRLLSTGSTSTCFLQFSVVSGSSYLLASASLTKGQFSHICAVFNRTNGQNNLQLFVDDALVSESEKNNNLGAFDIKPSPFLIGSGTHITLGSTTSTPTETLSGALDELRFFHSARTLSQVQKYARKSIFASPDLKLYYKFNEPTGTLGSSTEDTINRVVLDSSGNSLHGYINSASFSFNLRSTGSIDSPMTLEKRDLSPVLFPAFVDVTDLNSDLLFSASTYDSQNPNTISKLIPQHYFLEGQAFEGLSTELGDIVSSFSGSSAPGSGQLGTTQLLLSFLYVWAKFFDELKLFIDTFSSVHYVDYNTKNTAPDHFLPLVLKQYGFQVPSFFVDSSIEQFIDAENIQPVISTDEFSLQYIQNQIIRRVLSNILEIIKSKGTQHSIKAFLRSVGLDPDNSFRIREFGGPTKQQLLHARESKIEPGLMLDFVSGGLAQSPYLSGSRVETGYPGSSGNMVLKNLFYPHGVSSNPNDGLFTSGSWTFEAIYSWPVSRGVSDLTQSLVRFYTTGTMSGSPGLTFNLVAISSSIPNDTQTPRIKLFARPTVGDNTTLAPLFTLTLNDCNLFDGNRWNVSFGRQRNDSFGSVASSSYFLRAGRQEFGEIKNYSTTASYAMLHGTSPLASSTLQAVSTANTLGTYFVIGSGSIRAGVTTGSYYFLNNTNVSTLESRVTSFNGQVSRIRFWSREFSDQEWKEHIRNPKSLGVLDPSTNFNFETVKSGAWERLRIDAAVDQDLRDTDSSGNIRIFDYSQNNFHLSGTLFATSSQVIVASLWPFSLISPVFDEASTNDKVRIRSFQNSNLIEDFSYASVAPVYQILPSETPTDDTRFSIEFSLIDALNRDIINIFSTLEALDNALGNPELLFSPDYPSLEVLRGLYFNRLTEQINLKSFFAFYRWFDTSIGDFIEQLIPRKTKFLGTNFTIESHMLERSKFQYNFQDIYLGDSNRHNQKDKLLVQQIVGTLVKY